MDVCQLEAVTYKRLSIRLYVLMLFIGAMITVMGLLSSNRKEIETPFDDSGNVAGGQSADLGENGNFRETIRSVTLGLSLVYSFVAG